MSFVKHGQSNRGNPTSEYVAWQHMKSRCYDLNHKQYADYGGRGITVCDRWMDKKNGFVNFFSDMGKKPSSKHSLDRFPNNETGNYETSNCAWRLPAQQNRNTRKNKWLECDGERMVLQDWANKWGINYQEIQSLLKSNRSFKDIYNKYEKGVAIKVVREGEVRKNSRVIQVVQRGEVINEYSTISKAVRGEKVSKFKILNHINGTKYLHFKDKSKNKKIKYDYSVLDKYFRLKVA